jgi:RNA polymerase sigma-70 factor (ECF subfamily)
MTDLRPSVSDGDLLLCACRDPDAFAVFYLRYEALVAAYLMRQTRDAELAADLTAETFARALASARRFRDEGPAAGWLLGIARNLFLESLRRGRAETSARERLGVAPLLLGDASIERLEGLIDAAAAAPVLELALSRLSPEERAAVTAIVLEEEPYSLVAKRLDLAEPTIRKRVSRGLARMRAAMESYDR